MQPKREEKSSGKKFAHVTAPLVENQSPLVGLPVKEIARRWSGSTNMWRMTAGISRSKCGNRVSPRQQGATEKPHW